MLVAIYPYPLMLHAMTVGGWNLSEFQCQMVGFITGLSVVGSVFNIMAIAINRYCYICHSLQYERIFSMRNTIIFLIITWVLTVLAILPNVYVGTIQYDPRTYTCVYNYVRNPVFALVIVGIHFVLPLSIVGYCYTKIWAKVKEAREDPGQNPDHQFAEVRNFLTMFVIFLLFAVCWGPVNVLTVVVALVPKETASQIPHWLYLAAYLLAYFNSCLNAVIYGILNENFRREYWTIFHVMRHPLLFFSGLITDVRETRESRALARARVRARHQARLQARRLAREQGCSPVCPAVEEIPMSVRNVPLPGDSSAGQPECPIVLPEPISPPSQALSVLRKSASDHVKSAVIHPTSASFHPKPTTVYPKASPAHFKAASVQFRGDSAHFQPASSYPKVVTGHHIPAGSHSKMAFTSATSAIGRRNTATTIHIEPAPSHSEPLTGSFPCATALGYTVPSITGRFPRVMPDLPEPACSPVLRSPKPAVAFTIPTVVISSVNDPEGEGTVVLNAEEEEVAV